MLRLAGTPAFKYVCIALMMSALFILVLGQFTDIDLMIEDFYYDKTLQVFPWRKTWFARDLMHGSVKISSFRAAIC